MKLGHIVTMFVQSAVVFCLASACDQPDESRGTDLLETHEPSGKTTQSILTGSSKEKTVGTTVVQSALRDRPGICTACTVDCPRTPTMEPLGKICWLVATDCSCSGVRGCYYHCEPLDEPEVGFTSALAK